MNAKRQRLCAHVVQRDGPAELADPRHRAEQLRRSGGERAFGDLQDHPQVVGKLVGPVEQRGQRRVVQRVGLDVDEDGQRRQETLLDGAAQRCRAARLVQLGQAPRRTRGGEQCVGGEQRTLGPPRERLVGDDPAGVQLDDRLEEAGDGPVLEHRPHDGRRVIHKTVHVVLHRTRACPPRV
jgi:hypothetical protein